ncbi:MAG TPA: NrfD/PsrC family molybdoenzyme membrane anchor subunit [Myxococcales bacterium]|nr:NrfD/PsrC family molybdoenzyme membrane anchor subunit [Myxococcales bacterium]
MIEDGYHGMPLLKPPVWKETIAVYFFTGGLAGVSAAVAAAASFKGLKGLTRYGRRAAFAGALVSAALLIEDLGIRRRFIYMLRVFRPTSPMNVGTWILSAFGAASAGALLPGVAGDAAGVAAGVLGLPLAGYTGVLIGNTAVPIWSEGRNTLPPLFLASSAVSAASMFEVIGGSRAEQRFAQRLAVLSKLAELGAHATFERSVSRVSGALGASWTAARWGVVASLAISLVPRKPRALRIAGGCLGLVSSLASRFAVFRAGKRSALDPQATFAIQRSQP